MGTQKVSKAELLRLAKQKAANLLPNTQQRLQGAEAVNSYWVYNFKGKLYIGYPAGENLTAFFAFKDERLMYDAAGKPTAFLQEL